MYIFTNQSKKDNYVDFLYFKGKEGKYENNKNRMVRCNY